MLTLYLKAIGITAPGIPNWAAARQIFQQPETYQSQAVDKKLECLLPANERRRASRVTQMALSAAQQTGQAEELSQCRNVFSSANGDVTTFHQISSALAMPGRPVSPTRFHNSVHNAAAGYWSIATQSQAASTSITANQFSFAAGLLETAVQMHNNESQQDCLLVCYDEIPPAAFSSILAISSEFACAFRFSTTPENALYKMTIQLNPDHKPITRIENNLLRALSQSNPQGHTLALLIAIALQQTVVILPYFEQGLEINLIPVNHSQ